jgi:hypothetical protein
MQFSPRQRSLAVVLALLALPGASAGESTAESSLFAPGSIVRFKDVRAEDRWVQGTYLGLSAHAFWVRPASLADTLSVPLDMLRELHVYRGTHRRTAMGAVVGLIAGATVGAVLGVVTAVTTDGDYFEFGPEVIPFGMLLVGGSGALLGAAVGSQVTGERWESVPPPQVVGSRR